MSKRIFLIYKCIVVNKILIASIIRRIYINHINFTSMSVGQCCQRLKVIALNENMIRGIRIFADDSSFFNFCQDRELIA